MAALVAFLLQFVIFKFHYPFANYTGDSYSYLQIAASNADVGVWPVAYSKFLRFLSVFTHSDLIVIGIQYFFLQISSLLFLFSLLYFYPAGRWARAILLLFFVMDPIPLYIANYISSDTLFVGMSLLWVTSLLWIIYQPRSWMIVTHAVVLLACFMIRYNAIFYPLVSLIAIVLCHRSWKYKLTGILFGIGAILTSIMYTSQEMQSISGKRQFSAFGGWQIANNALYMYEHIPARERGPVPERFVRLEAMVREHMDTLNRIKLTHYDSISTHFYLWNEKGPLIQYLNREYKKDRTTPYFRKWASEGPLYADYGMYLIHKYPVQFLKSFVLPNFVKFVVPPVEFLGMYNMGLDSVNRVAKDWFNYKSLKITDHDKTRLQSFTIGWYPIFNALVNVLFVIALIGIIVLNTIKWKDYGLPQLLSMAATFWLLNCGFSIIAAPVVLRYQIFPVIVFFTLSVLMVEKIWKLS
jgi:hypothetical protein